ncbi:hypothetical protein F7725_002686 [Dissostichus mawsoni]|uniref:Uncharacterized protein n=1 Tax=Dissostichus mawsoni TaxID=36200 RepID=A0A7J5Y5B4_DISMA|nr:hypothetical protein F7725_002686 [Dissostichus mawsoni]
MLSGCEPDTRASIFTVLPTESIMDSEGLLVKLGGTLRSVIGERGEKVRPSFDSVTAFGIGNFARVFPGRGSPVAVEDLQSAGGGGDFDVVETLWLPEYEQCSFRGLPSWWLTSASFFTKRTGSERSNVEVSHRNH